MRKHQAERRGGDADQRDEQRGAVTHQPLAQAEHRAHRGRHAHGEQADRRGFDHAQAKPEHQQRHRQDAAPGAGQRQHCADDRAQSGAEQLQFDHGCRR
jgi:hypothetical protein